jgi:RNA polymerase sigma factor (sigma-70 family)
MTDISNNPTADDESSDAVVSLAGHRQPLSEDQEKFSALYEDHSRLLYDYLARRSGADLAADLMQSTFLKAWEKRESLHDQTKARSWLFAIAENELRRHHRDNHPTVSLDVAENVEVEAALHPEKAALTGETTELVWSAARALESRQLKVLDLTVRYGMDREEIAEVMGVSVPHASVLMTRSREALGHAVKTKLVATQAERCDGVTRLVPTTVAALTPEQHRSVDRHMRTCDACKSVASHLTDPAALFSTIGLVALPEALRQLHWNANGQPALSAQETAARFWQRHLTRGLVIGAAALAILGLGVLGGTTLLPQHASTANSRQTPVPSQLPTASPTSTGTPSPTPPSPNQMWAQLLDKIRNANTYHVAYTNSAISSQFISRDVHVSKSGNWYGTITNTDSGPTPMTVSYDGGQLYAQGGLGFVNSHLLLSLSTQQAEALGSGWISLTNDESSMASLVGMFLQPLVSPGDLADSLSPFGAVTEKTFANPDGTTSIQLNDGQTTVTIAPNGTVTFAKGQESWVIDSINTPVAQPSPSPLKAVAQLKAAAP